MFTKHESKQMSLYHTTPFPDVSFFQSVLKIPVECKSLYPPCRCANIANKKIIKADKEKKEFCSQILHILVDEMARTRGKS